jgi:phosphate-selective porin OprO/OprP
MKPRHTKTHALMGVALGALMIGQGPAQADSTQAEIKLLKERLKQLEAKVAEQSKKEKALAKDVAAHGMYGAPKGPPMVCKDGPCEPIPLPPPVWVSFTNGLRVESFEKDFSFKIGGRIFVDGGISSQPETGYSGTVGFRRARLEVEGKAFRDFFYKLQYDFAGSSTAATPGGTANAVIGGMRDAFLGYRLNGVAQPLTKEPIVLMVGNMYEPMGLETLTSSKYITFIERSLPSDALTPSRHIGAAVGTFGSDWTAKVGIFSTSPEDSSLNPFAQTPPPAPGGVATGGGQYFDVTGRLTWAPVHTEDALIHLGASGRFHKPNSATGTAAVGGTGSGGSDNRVLLLGSNTQTEANILRENLVGTQDLSCGPITVNGAAVAGRCISSVVGYGAELAASYGPFNFQGEFMGANYNRNGGALAYAGSRGAGVNAVGSTSLSFYGFYVYGSWFITGESRAEAYNLKDVNSAAFEEIKILDPVSKGGLGAWELGARYSQLNLNDGGIQGGKQEDITVGINWYPQKGFRLMANWINVVNLAAPYNRPYLNGIHPNIFLMRAQVHW